MEQTLSGLHIAILLTDGFEQAELTRPQDALQQAGAATSIISTKSGSVQGFNHDEKADTFGVDRLFSEASPEEFDGVLLPGGVMNADQIRMVPEARAFVRAIDASHKPIAVICHGAWLLVSAGIIKGRTLTSWPTLQDDIRNAGGTWVDQDVVLDQNWVSSRKPDDLPAFNAKLIELFESRFRGSPQGSAEHAGAPGYSG
ncbi:MAG: type 1 glutamine amidotransferase domain-containing protein [Burkholderiaceae bacterium]